MRMGVMFIKMRMKMVKTNIYDDNANVDENKDVDEN